MQTTDTAIINIPLSKRGNIDNQIDVYKKAQKKETIQAGRDGVMHLYKDGYVRVFANRTQAENAATRTGGEAYQSRLSNRFMVRFPVKPAEFTGMDAEGFACYKGVQL